MKTNCGQARGKNGFHYNASRCESRHCGRYFPTRESMALAFDNINHYHHHSMEGGGGDKSRAGLFIISQAIRKECLDIPALWVDNFPIFLCRSSYLKQRRCARVCIVKSSPGNSTVGLSMECRQENTLKLPFNVQS